jgi:hypothetical protein
MKNVGKSDAALRYVLAGLCLLVPIVINVSGPVRIGLYVAAFILAATATVGFCGAYKIFGINTCALKEE